MSKEYSIEYRGFLITRQGDGLTIYDNKGGYVKRVDAPIISAAKEKIDKIIKNSK